MQQQGQEYQDSIDYYGNALSKVCDDIRYEGENSWPIFKYLCIYHNSKGNFKETKRILYDCLNYYVNTSEKRLDIAYIDIIKNLIVYLGTYESSLDECHALAERLKEDFEGFDKLGYYEGYIQSYILLYNLIEGKNPYETTILNQYLNKIYDAVTAYWEASNHNDIVWYNYRLFVIDKMLSYMSRTDSFRKMGIMNNYDISQFENNVRDGKNYISKDVIPELEYRRKQLESLGGNNMTGSLNYYVNIIYCQALASEYCTENIEDAEKYYRELVQYAGDEGLLMLCNFLLRHDKIDDAVTIARQIDTKFHTLLSSVLQNTETNLLEKTSVLNVVFSCYYKAHQMTDALRVGREFLEYYTIFLNKNLDYMTQTEREGFLMNNGSGSAPILSLLPYMPDELAEDAYNLALRDKGLLLRASDRIQQAIARSGDNSLLGAVDSLRLLQNRLSSIQTTHSDAMKLYARTREQIDSLERFVSRRTAQYRSDEDNVPTWQQVRDNLKKGEAAVEYLFADSVCMALIVTPGCSTPKSVDLMGADESLSLLRQIIGKKPVDVANMLYDQKNTFLYNKLWKPLESYFQGAKDIYFSPSQVLSTLSFAAFPLDDGTYLIDHYDLHQLTSTSQIAYRDKKLKGKKSKEISSNIYGAIYYNSEQKDYYEPRLTELRKRLGNSSGLAQNAKNRGQAESFPFLEWSLLETDLLESVMKSHGVRTIKETGSEPTENSIRSISETSPDILLISTHGFFYTDMQKALQIPFFKRHEATLNSMTTTGLVLADGERAWDGEELPEESDNILTSYEVSKLDLTNTDLVILSACETALGGFSSEGVYGLQRGFKQAGVNSICASLWSVNDMTTAELISTFLSKWLADPVKTSKYQAMKEAMLLQRTKTPSPIYWAPFVLYDADIK